MKRQAWLLGFFSLSGQVLLLREVVTSLNGDELLIGTALFGWLLAVSLGSIVGGKVKCNTESRSLFVAGAMVLPLTLIALRLSPRVAGFAVGEVVGFGEAVLISSVLMMPVGMVSGWLFASIARSGHEISTSITKVYLWEGLGAFAAGMAISLVMGGALSSIAVAIILGGLVMAVSSAEIVGNLRWLVVIAALAAAVIVVSVLASNIDRKLDGIRYRPWMVEASFDTHYGHQTILSNSGALSVLTDNKVEGVYPDLNRFENLLIPPLLYRPSIKEVLITGQTGLGFLQLADSLATIHITGLDPRRQLTQTLGSFVEHPERASAQIEDDPVSYMARNSSLSRYDLIIVDAGELNCYKNSRLVTPEFLVAVRSCLAADGLLLLPLHYDTDRYISPEVKKLLSIVYGTVRKGFDHVLMWPGNITLLFASRAPIADLPVDSLVVAIKQLSYRPQFVNEYYLYERLAEGKRQRLKTAVASSEDINSVNRPILPHYQAMYRAGKRGRQLFNKLLSRPEALLALPAAMITLGLMLSLGKEGKRRYGLFLYFVAGAVSLTLELVSFYVFQSIAGSLYSEMAALIGSFMLGLGLGTFLARQYGGNGLEFASQMLLLLITFFFLFSYDHYDPSVILYFHLAFQFAVAVATAGLFVAATSRYYGWGQSANCGLGYAVELAGSAVGGLISMTILLPALGVHLLLLSVTGIVALALLGSVLAELTAA